MNRRDVGLIGIGIVLIGTFVYFGFFYGETTGEVVGSGDGTKELNGHYTTAVCKDSGYCQDYVVYCNNGNVVEMHLIEDSDYQHNEDWVDSRSEEERTLCHGR